MLDRLQEAAPAPVQLGAAGISVVLSALWDAATGVLVLAMVLLFFSDLALGVFRAIHVGGLDAFEWPRFWRKFLELAAAAVGIVIAVSIDLLLREIGAPENAAYITSGLLGGVAIGFAVSALKNLAYFFPGVDSLVDVLVRRRTADGPAS